MRIHFALAISLLSPSAFAQSSAGQITGTIADQQSAVLAGVKIIAVNLDTNIQQSAVTSNAGVYSLPALEPGRYRLTAELSGFNKLVKEPILVETSKVTAIDFGNLAFAADNAALQFLSHRLAELVGENERCLV